MKKITYFILALALLSCGNGTPQCSDKEVLLMTLKLTKEQLRPLILKQIISKIDNFYPPTFLYTHDISVTAAIDSAKIGLGIPLTFDFIKTKEDLKDGVTVSDNYSYLDSLIDSFNSKLEGIRTNSVDQTSHSCNCTARVILVGFEPYDINYEAQKSDDGKIFVQIK